MGEKPVAGNVRAFSLPVAAPVDMSWQDLAAVINPAFRLSTDLANWCVRRLFMLDDATSTKTPIEIKNWYGYGDASKHYPAVGQWAGAMASFNLVTRAVKAKYIQQRFSVMVRHDSSLLTYRFPQPYHLHNATWSVEMMADGPHFSVAMPGAGRVVLRLRQGREFGRQLGMLRQILDGTAKKGEAALYRDRKGHLLCKMVGTFPVRPPDTAPANACFLHTDPNALLVAEVNGRSATITNGDHIRRCVSLHKRFVQRAGEDKKREVRMDHQQRRNLNIAVENRCDKQRHRVDTAIHQVTAQVVRFCERQKVGIVVYDDANQSFIPEGFPWFTVCERLKYKLEDVGIVLLSRSTLDPKEFEEWLQAPSLERARAMLLASSRLATHVSRPPRKSHPAVSAPPATSAGSAAVSSTTSSRARSRGRSPAPSAAPAT